MTTEGKRDVDILLAIGGTGSGSWLNQNCLLFFPNGEGKTGDGSRWLSHLRNWTHQEIADHYGDGEEDEAKFLNGPDDPWGLFGGGAFGQDSNAIIDAGYVWLSEQYWEAVESGAEPKVDIIGMSRGGMIASEIAWRIDELGYRKGSTFFTPEPEKRKIRFLGLYDPVDQTNTVDERQEVAPNVEFSALGVAKPFSGEEVSRYYWERIPYANASSKRSFSATHSAFQGSPTYSTDPGIHVLGGPILVGPHTNHPSAWLDGYTDNADVTSSIQIDTWFREKARTTFVPINLVSPTAYAFGTLHADPNSESPNHENGYSAQ